MGGWVVVVVVCLGRGGGGCAIKAEQMCRLVGWWSGHTKTIATIRWSFCMCLAFQNHGIVGRGSLCSPEDSTLML